MTIRLLKKIILVGLHYKNFMVAFLVYRIFRQVTGVEHSRMSVVKVGKKYSVCATCEFWNGPRGADGNCSTFDNNTTGICLGEGFYTWKVGAVSTCLKWRLWTILENAEQ